MVFSRKEMDYNEQFAVRNTNNPWTNKVLDATYLSSIYPRTSLCDYIITIDADGNITATPQNSNGLAVVTGTDLGQVVNDCVAAISSAAWGGGTIGIAPPTGYGQPYQCLTTMDMNSSVDLIALGDQEWDMVLLDFSSSIGLSYCIINGNLIQGLFIRSTNGVNGIREADVVRDCALRDGGAGTVGVQAFYTWLIDSSIYGFDVAFHLAYSRTIASRILCNSITNTFVIDADAEDNRVSGIIDYSGHSPLDNSGKVNIIEGVQTGILTAPAVTTSLTPNTFGTKVEVVISIGATATEVTKNADVVFQSTVAVPACVTVTLNAGESISLDQTTDVTWKWFAI